MAEIIADGKGSGKKARVDLNHNLGVYAVVKPENEVATKTGNKYNISTGDITLTSGSESAVFYLKNNEADDLIINSFIYNLGNSTGGTGDILVKIYKNPSVGSIVSNASDVEVNTNMNFGSNKSLEVNAYKGAEGYTFTDGILAVPSRVNSSGRVVVSLGSVNIPKGSSVGVKVTPPASNTNIKIQIAVSCFLRSSEVSGEE